MSMLWEMQKIKNEASVLILGRFMWDDEYEGGKHELLVNQWDEFAGDYIDKPMKKKKDFNIIYCFTRRTDEVWTIRRDRECLF